MALGPGAGAAGAAGGEGRQPGNDSDAGIGGGLAEMGLAPTAGSNTPGDAPCKAAASGLAVALKAFGPAAGVGPGSEVDRSVAAGDDPKVKGAKESGSVDAAEDAAGLPNIGGETGLAGKLGPAAGTGNPEGAAATPPTGGFPAAPNAVVKRDKTKPGAAAAAARLPPKAGPAPKPPKPEMEPAAGAAPKAGGLGAGAVAAAGLPPRAPTPAGDPNEGNWTAGITTGDDAALPILLFCRRLSFFFEEDVV